MVILRLETKLFLATKPVLYYAAFLHPKHCQTSLTSLNCSILTLESVLAPSRQFSGYFVFTVPTFHSIVTTPAASHSPAAQEVRTSVTQIERVQFRAANNPSILILSEKAPYYAFIIRDGQL